MRIRVTIVAAMALVSAVGFGWLGVSFSDGKLWLLPLVFTVGVLGVAAAKFPFEHIVFLLLFCGLIGLLSSVSATAAWIPGGYAGLMWGLYLADRFERQSQES